MGGEWCGNGCPDRYLHTASCQTRMGGTHQIVKFSHLLLARLPRATFTPSKLPNPDGRNTSRQNFRIFYCHGYPERCLRTASRQTRMAGTHQGKIFASSLGTATPSEVYTQQAAKPAWRELINAKFSRLLLSRLPRTTFTHCKPPNPHGANTSRQNFRVSFWRDYPEQRLHLASCQTRRANPQGRHTSTKYFRSSSWHGYPGRRVHTASCQTRMPATHQRKIFAPPINTATPNDVYTQQAAKPTCQQRINAKFSQLLLAQLPRTTFTHSKLPNPQGKPAGQTHINKKFSQLLLAQLPRKTFTHSKLPNPHASNASTQNFRTSYWHSYPERCLHTASCHECLSV